MTRVVKLAALLGMAAVISCGGGAEKASISPADTALAQKILADESLDTVCEKGREIIASGFNAGDGYGQVWIRDLATFIDTSCEVYDKEAIRDNLLTFFKFQGDDGNIIDGFAPIDKAHPGDKNLITTDLAPDLFAHKNTVETDQESSLIQAVYIYIGETGDTAFLDETIAGKTVLERMGMALEFLMNERFNEKYGLIWGATTADWGDVQPENGWGVDMNEHTAKAIDIYDNAMFVLAINNYLTFMPENSDTRCHWKNIKNVTASNIRTHLWDAENNKFRAHIYLENGSPFSSDYDESVVSYHGGTAVAILADLLTKEEIKVSIELMRANVRESGAGSIGLTVYPPYPEKEFPNMAPYHYQNGGDWTWFGGRMISALIRNGFIDEAYAELKPMTDRVIANDGFYEWYSVNNEPRGSGTFRGSAGVLCTAIGELKDWAKEHAGS